jgi:hypothetical protein
MTGTNSSARLVLSWALFAVGAVIVIMSMIEGFTADPQQGEGWIGGPIQAGFAGGPVIAVAFGLRSSRRLVARRTAIASLLLALVVGFVLVMQVTDPNETATDVLATGAGMAVYLAAFVVELPAFSDRWPPDAPIDGPRSEVRGPTRG